MRVMLGTLWERCASIDGVLMVILAILTIPAIYFAWTLMPGVVHGSIPMWSGLGAAIIITAFAASLNLTFFASRILSTVALRLTEKYEEAVPVRVWELMQPLYEQVQARPVTA